MYHDDDLRQEIIERLKAKADANPFHMIADPDATGRFRNARQVYKHVANNTPLGKRFLRHWEELAFSWARTAELA